MTRVVVCCGSGGVGKTTLSAALALNAALAGKRVAVLTIDPARRLADSLDIGTIGNTPRRVPLEVLKPGAAGALDAVMLDAKATFDDLVRRSAASPERAESILANHYYQVASTRLGGSHEYMAMMRLLDLVECGRYDVVVLDTPPTRHALEFLTSPDRLEAVLDEGVLRWLILPSTKGGWRALELGSEAVSRVLRRLVGVGTVSEIGEFFELTRDLGVAIARNSGRARRLLASASTQFYLVTSPAPGAREEALYFLQVLGERKLPFGGFIVNRTALPPERALDPNALPEEGPLPPERWRAVMAGVARAPLLRRQLATAHARAIEALRAAGPAGAPCWKVPDQEQDLHTLQGLAALVGWLPEVG